MAQGAGSDLDTEFKLTISQLKPYAKLLPHKSDDRRHTALWIKKLLSCNNQKKERNDYSKLLLDMLQQGVLRDPFTSSPPTGMLKCVVPYMLQKTSRDVHTDFMTTSGANTTFLGGSFSTSLQRSSSVAGPTAASTPAKPQGRGSRIPVRHQLQEPHPFHKATQPIIDSRSVQSASIGYSSPRVPSSVGGASEHRSASLPHPTTVTQHPLPAGMGMTQHHHPTRVTVTQQHPPSGLTVTQQHGVSVTHSDTLIKKQQQHPMGLTVAHSNTLMKTQHQPTMIQYPHSMGATMTQQHYPMGVMMTQVNATQADSAGHDVDQINYGTFDDENSLNQTTGTLDDSSISSVDLTTEGSTESDVSDVAALLQSKPQPRVALPQSPAVPSLGSIASPMTARTSFTSPEASGYQVTSPLKHDSSRSRLYNKEMEMRLKSAEVKHNEDKLQLHKRHELAMKQVLDRKNEELEDSRADYRLQLQRLETLVKRHERREAQLERECKHLREQKEKQYLEWKNSSQYHKQSVQAECDSKLEEVMKRYEREKQQLQQSHSQHIQQLLDETSSRMTRLEQEYNSQAQESTLVITELELKLQQLNKEAGLTSSTHSKLLQEKGVMETQCARLQKELDEAQDRALQLEDESKQAEQEWDLKLQKLRSQTDMTVQQLQQQLAVQEEESSSQLTQVNNQVIQLQQVMAEKESAHHNQITELKAQYKKEMTVQLEQRDKLAHSAIADLEKKLQQYKQKQHKLQSALKDSQEQAGQLRQSQLARSQQSERALQEYKVEMEHSTSQLFQQMKNELQNMEAELSQARGQLSKSSKDHKRLIEDERKARNKEVSTLHLQHEQDKAQLTRDIQWQLETVKKEYQQDKEGTVSRLNGLIAEQKSQAKLQASQSSKELLSMGAQVRQLQQQLDESRTQSKQEVTNVRRRLEQEKKRINQAHEITISKLKSQLEQQRQQLQEEHHREMNTVMEKTNSRLKQLEKDYAARAAQSSETITSLQVQLRHLQDVSDKMRLTHEDQLSELARRCEEDKETLKQHHMSQLKTLHQELDSVQNNTRQLEERHHHLQLASNEKISRLKLQNEERVRGLLPASVKQEYEDTIASLKTQVSLLSQRASLLQEELDRRVSLNTSKLLAPPITSPVSNSSKLNSSSSS